MTDHIESLRQFQKSKLDKETTKLEEIERIEELVNSKEGIRLLTESTSNSGRYVVCIDYCTAEDLVSEVHSMSIVRSMKIEERQEGMVIMMVLTEDVITVTQSNSQDSCINTFKT